MKKKRLLIYFSIIVLAMGYSSLVRAGTISGVLGGNIWTGWTQFQDNGNAGHGGPSEDWVDGNKVYPGFGGQGFDAEYLFYKLDGDTLSLGLQTGFDVVTGKVRSGSKDYYTGDIALSFDGTTNYSHALDFGLLSKDYYNHNVGADGGFHNGNISDGEDDAGLYSVSEWNTHVISSFGASNPFAMDGGTFETGFSFIESGSGMLTNSKGSTDTSFYRQVSFDISSFRDSITQELSVDAHWTMSCGNDAINGSLTTPSFAPPAIPEPGTIALVGIGLVGLAGVVARRRLKKKAVDKSLSG